MGVGRERRGRALGEQLNGQQQGSRAGAQQINVGFRVLSLSHSGNQEQRVAVGVGMERIRAVGEQLNHRQQGSRAGVLEVYVACVSDKLAYG